MTQNKMIENPGLAVVTVGDELVLGERNNDNARWMAEWLKENNQPARIQIALEDNVATIALWFQTLLQKGHKPILVAGGIGGTHDDCTRAGIAEAIGVHLIRHPECWKQLSVRYGSNFNESRQNMAMLPEGCELIENPYGAPGFKIGDIYAFPGFPHMLEAMLPQVCKGLEEAITKQRWKEENVRLKTNEGNIADQVREFYNSVPKCKLGIYAHSGISCGEVSLRFRYPESNEELKHHFQEFVDHLGYSRIPKTPNE